METIPPQSEFTLSRKRPIDPSQRMACRNYTDMEPEVAMPMRKTPLQKLKLNFPSLDENVSSLITLDIRIDSQSLQWQLHGCDRQTEPIAATE